MSERSGFLKNYLNIGMWYSRPNSWFSGDDSWTVDNSRYEISKKTMGADVSYALNVAGGDSYGLYLTFGGYVNLENVIQRETKKTIYSYNKSFEFATVTENSSRTVGLKAGLEARTMPFGVPVSTELSGRAGYLKNSPANYNAIVPFELCLGITAYGVGLQAVLDGGLRAADAPEKTAYSFGILLRPTDWLAIWGRD